MQSEVFKYYLYNIVIVKKHYRIDLMVKHCGLKKIQANKSAGENTHSENRKRSNSRRENKQLPTSRERERREKIPSERDQGTSEPRNDEQSKRKRSRSMPQLGQRKNTERREPATGRIPPKSKLLPGERVHTTPTNGLNSQTVEDKIRTSDNSLGESEWITEGRAKSAVSDRDENSARVRLEEKHTRLRGKILLRRIHIHH